MALQHDSVRQNLDSPLCISGLAGKDGSAWLVVVLKIVTLQSGVLDSQRSQSFLDMTGKCNHAK